MPTNSIKISKSLIKCGECHANLNQDNPPKSPILFKKISPSSSLNTPPLSEP
jgi:hypothetical protein